MKHGVYVVCKEKQTQISDALSLPLEARLWRISPMCASSSLSERLCVQFPQSHRCTWKEGEWRCGWTCRWRWSQGAESPNCNTKGCIWKRNRLSCWLQATDFSRTTELWVPSPTQSPVNFPNKHKVYLIKIILDAPATSPGASLHSFGFLSHCLPSVVSPDAKSNHFSHLRCYHCTPAQGSTLTPPYSPFAP